MHGTIVLFSLLTLVFVFCISSWCLRRCSCLHISILYFYNVSAQMLLFLYFCHLLCAAIPLLDVTFERCQHALLGDASSITISHKHGFGVMLYRYCNTQCIQSNISHNHKYRNTPRLHLLRKTMLSVLFPLSSSHSLNFVTEKQFL